MPERLRHGRVPMAGRDPDESHRVATPLELLFDLTFVVAFGLAADELAHFLAEEHVGAGIIGFCFAAFGISWAWINFSWFASAFDTDDWLYRLTTMLQMVGVIVFALGLPVMFDSIEKGEHLDNRVMVAGYVVMRVAMVIQWARAARHSPDCRPACTTYITTILIAQAGWVALIFAPVSVGAFFAWAAPLVLIELAGPAIAETRMGGTPWHPHHIAERYGLLVIIALGEGIIGTVASLSAVVGPHGPGWSLDATLVALAGISLTFGMWWTYFVVPSGEILALRRDRRFGWGYGHIPLIAAVVATGAGLHVAAYYLGDESKLDAEATVLAAAVPVAAYLLGLYVLYTYLVPAIDRFHIVLIALTVPFVAGPLLLASAGASMPWCLIVLSGAPWVTVVGYELRGHAHNARMLERLRSEPAVAG